MSSNARNRQIFSTPSQTRSGQTNTDFCSIFLLFASSLNKIPLCASITRHRQMSSGSVNAYSHYVTVDYNCI